MRFRSLSTDDYVIPGRTVTERKDAVDRRHSAWVGQWIKDRSKTSYELRRYAGSLVYNATRDILKVRDFLRHASVETTQQWYAYLLEDVPSIGMDDFVPALRAADPYDHEQALFSLSVMPLEHHRRCSEGHRSHYFVCMR